MPIKEKIEKDLIEALRAKDRTRMAALRLLKSALENKRIELMKALKDEEVINVLRSEAKKRKESIEAYEAAERDDLVKVEKEELEIIESYLPAQMSEEEVEKKVKEIFEKIPEDQRDFGKVMGMVMKELKGKADGAVVNKVVKKILA